MPATLARPPGPRGLPLVGSVLDLARDPIGSLVEWHRAFGDRVEIRLGPYRFWLLNDPEDVRHVLEDNHANYPKSPNYRELELLLGKGLLTSDGAFWLRQRKLVQPAFHPRQDELSFASMLPAIEAVLAGWESGGEATFDVAPDMMRLALGAVSRALFGRDLGGEASGLAAALAVLTRDVEARWVSIVRWPRVLPTPGNLRARRAAAVVDALVNGLIAERRSRGDPGDDLLGALLRARDEGTSEGMTDRQVRDEVVTLLLAGHETTAVTLTWTLWLLALHPEVSRPLAAEVASLPERVSVEDVRRLKWPALVVQESLRLYPPAWWIEREAKGVDELHGYRVEPGTIMILAPYTLHRHPRYWERPHEFDPERFLPERSEGRPRFAYYPFGAGPRICIGSRFALLEAQLALALIFRRWRFEVDVDHQVEPVSLVTLKPKNGIRLVRRRR